MSFGIKGEVEKKQKIKNKILLICEGERTDSDYFQEICKDKTNKSNLHDLIDLIDNFK